MGLRCAVCLVSVLAIAAAQPEDVDSQIQQHFIAAQTAQRSGDLDTAAREYKAITKIKPDFAEIHMNLGLVEHAQGKFDESAVSLERSLKLKPGLFAAMLFQGINYCKLGRPAEAVPLLSKTALEQPSNKQARFWLGTALIESRKPVQAALELEKASEVLRDDVDVLQLLGEAYQKAARKESEQVKDLDPGSLERRLLLAESFLQQQEIMAAEIYYRKLLEQNKPPAGTHLGLGTILLRQGKVDEAMAQFREELKADAYSVEGHVGLAESLLLQGKLTEALDSLRSAWKIRPDQTRATLETADAAVENLPDSLRARYQEALDAWSKTDGPDPAITLGLALAYVRLGKAEEAQKQVQSMAIAPAAPVDEPVSRAAALECVGKRQYEAAIGGLRRHLKTQPQDVEARLALARSYLETRQPGQAARELRRVLEADPKNVSARLWLGKAYRDLSLVTFERILSLQPDSYRAHQLAAEAYEARNQDEKALAEYRAALQTRPSLPGLHLGIARVHLKNLRLEEAAGEFQKELEINPFDADANVDLGGIYVNQEQPEKAIPLLERALKVQPGLTEGRRRLGKAYFNVGQFEKAEAELQKAAPTDDDGSTHYLLARTYRQLGRAREAEEALATVTRIKAAKLKQAQERAERVRQLDR
jgi:tetratricopeptide (TPR) repeat protein